jgi:biotin carboxylase
VAPFAALARVQDKVTARATLEAAGVAQPRSVVVRDRSDLDAWSAYPAFVKAPIGTASSAVRRVEDRSELAAAVLSLLGSEAAVLVQEGAEGTLVMAQSVFDGGTMIAFHANERVREGVNGSASVKRSMDLPELRAAMDRLGSRLSWHGALSLDAIVTADGPVVIDVNPRLVEPANAIAAGSDLVALLLGVATGTTPTQRGESRPGVTTHQLLMAVLGAAQHTGRRRAVVGEIAAALTHRAAYAGSHEELLPLRGDWRTLSLPVLATMATLVHPASYRWFAQGAVAGYALSAQGWRALSQSAPSGEVTPGAS